MVMLEQNYLLYIGGVIFLLFYYFMFGRLKKAVLEGKEITISNYIKSISLPVDEIESIRFGLWFAIPNHVYVKFKNKTELGQEIVFWRNDQLSKSEIKEKLKS